MTAVPLSARITFHVGGKMRDTDIVRSSGLQMKPGAGGRGKQSNQCSPGINRSPPPLALLATSLEHSPLRGSVQATRDLALWPCAGQGAVGDAQNRT